MCRTGRAPGHDDRQLGGTEGTTTRSSARAKLPCTLIVLYGDKVTTDSHHAGCAHAQRVGFPPQPE